MISFLNFLYFKDNAKYVNPVESTCPSVLRENFFWEEISIFMVNFSL